MFKMEDQKYYEKYLKYKAKYLGLQKLIGGDVYKKFIVCTHPQRLQCILASLFSEKYLSSEEKKLKFYDGTIIKIYEEKNVEGQGVESKSICKNVNKHFKFMMINPSNPEDDKSKYKEFWVNESFNYKYNTLCIPLVINGENMFIYDQQNSNENIVIYLVCSNSISDSQSEPCKKICNLINSDLILKGDDRISNYYLGCSNFNKSIALINAIKNVMSTEIKQASQNLDVPLPIVIPCLNEVFYKEDGNCDGILATTATVAKKITTDMYSDECKVGSANYDLVNWSIIDKFKQKNIACSLIHIIPFIYYIGSNNCEVEKINTKLEDKQFFKQTNIRKGVEALKSFGKSIKGLFSKKPAEVQPSTQTVK